MEEANEQTWADIHPGVADSLKSRRTGGGVLYAFLSC